MTLTRSQPRPRFAEPPRRGDVVMCEVVNDDGSGKTKDRIAIVTGVNLEAPGGPYFSIVWGTETRRTVLLEVDQESSAYRSMRLSKQTYFNKEGREEAELADLWPRQGATLSPVVFNKILQKLGR